MKKIYHEAGTRIRALREEKHYSRERLSEMAGISPKFLYEVENGVYKVNFKPAKKLPVIEFIKTQKRFKHMLKPGNEWMIDELQAEIDRKWEYILMMEEITNKKED